MSASKPVIWLVDDSPLEAEHVKRLLSPDHVVELYAEGAAMLERLATGTPPEILILDVGLPGIGGVELCQFVRSRFDERAMQILMLTSQSKKSTLVAALAAGANDYMTKPFDPVELVARVGVLLRSRELFQRTSAAEEASKVARLELQAEQDRLETLLAHAPTGICVLEGPEHHCAFANAAFDRLVGVRCPVGSPLTQALPNLGPHGLRAVLDHVYQSGETLVIQALPLGEHGTDSAALDRVVKVTYQPRRDSEGQVVGIDLFAFDVTEQFVGKRKMEELLSIASHELKTPVTALLLHLQVLQRALERKSEQLCHDRIKSGLSVIDRQIKRQMRLVDDLLDVSRLVAGKLKLEMEELQVEALTYEVAERFEAELARVGSTLSLDIPAPVVATVDRLRLDQVLTNLLSNALKYGQGNPIQVSLHSIGSRRLRLTVRDHGIGIAPENLGRVFERFERAVSERNYAGLGLGLWITRRIVESMRGTISVESKVGVGSTFTVELPRDDKTWAAGASQDA